MLNLCPQIQGLTSEDRKREFVIVIDRSGTTYTEYYMSYSVSHAVSTGRVTNPRCKAGGLIWHVHYIIYFRCVPSRDAT